MDEERFCVCAGVGVSGGKCRWSSETFTRKKKREMGRQVQRRENFRGKGTGDGRGMGVIEVLTSWQTSNQLLLVIARQCRLNIHQKLVMSSCVHTPPPDGRAVIARTGETSKLLGDVIHGGHSVKLIDNRFETDRRLIAVQFPDSSLSADLAWCTLCRLWLVSDDYGRPISRKQQWHQHVRMHTHTHIMDTASTTTKQHIDYNIWAT